MRKVRILSKDKLFYDSKHLLALAKTGSAKTGFIEAIAMQKYMAGCKIIFFTLKSEACQLGFPENDPKMVNLIYREGSEPQGFPHEVLVPFIVSQYEQIKNNKMRIVLPKHKDWYVGMAKRVLKENPEAPVGWTYWKPFKLSFPQLRSSDLIVMLKSATSAGSTALEMLFRSTKFNSIDEMIRTLISLTSKVGGNELVVGYGKPSAKSEEDVLDEEVMVVNEQKLEQEAVIGKSEIFAGLLRLMSNVQKSGVLCEEDNFFKLDLDKIMQEDNVITTFNLATCKSEEFAFLVFVAIMRQILELRNPNERRRGKGYSQLCLVFPELANYAPSKPSISPYAVAGYSSLSILQTLSRESRGFGVTLITDSQIPSDISRTTIANFGWIIVGNLQVEAVKTIHTKVIRLPKPIYLKAPQLQTGAFGVLEMGEKDFSYPVISCPCPAHHKPSNEDVLDWISKKNYIEEIVYEDSVKDSLVVRIRPKMVATGEKIGGEKEFVLEAIKSLKDKAEKDKLKIDITYKKIEKQLLSMNSSMYMPGYKISEYINRIVPDIDALGLKKVLGGGRVHLVSKRDKDSVSEVE